MPILERSKDPINYTYHIYLKIHSIPKVQVCTQNCSMWLTLVQTRNLQLKILPDLDL